MSTIFKEQNLSFYFMDNLPVGVPFLSQAHIIRASRRNVY